MNLNHQKFKKNNENLIKLVDNYFLKEVEFFKSNYRFELSRVIFDYIIETSDGSYTLLSPNFDGNVETMHNSNGAITESFEKFVKPFKSSYFRNRENKSLSDNGKIVVLDLCGGLGYNSAALIDDFLDLFPSDLELSVDIVEISIETLATGLVIPSPVESHGFVKKAVEAKLIEEGFAGLSLEESEIPDNVSIRIFIDDARNVIKNLLDNNYDAVFLDPYSPAWAPELCTVDFFKELKRVIKFDGIVATYTLAAGVRFALIDAGFYIGEGPVFGRKSGGTIASLNIDNIVEDISKEDERTIALSDAGIPFRDPGLNLNGSEILENRRIERKLARHNYKLSSAVQSPVFVGSNISDEKLKRRITRNLNRVNIPSLESEEAFHVISPQYKYCFSYPSKYDFRNIFKFDFKLRTADNFRLFFNSNIKCNLKSNFKSILNYSYRSNSKDRIIDMSNRLKRICN